MHLLDDLNLINCHHPPARHRSRHRYHHFEVPAYFPINHTTIIYHTNTSTLVLWLVVDTILLYSINNIARSSIA